MREAQAILSLLVHPAFALRLSAARPLPTTDAGQPRSACDPGSALAGVLRGRLTREETNLLFGRDTVGDAAD